MLSCFATSWARACRHCGQSIVLCCGLASCADIGAEYRDAGRGSDPPARRVFGGDPQRGRALIGATGCGVCHSIPGVQGARGVVGPPLAGFGQRQLIGGIVPNQPGILVRWVRDAPSIAPRTGMPRMPLSDEQAKHVAAYLYTLR